MKVFLRVLGFSALHFLAAIGVFAYVWNPGDDSNQVPSLFTRACYTAWDVLWFPFEQIAGALNVRGASLAEVLVFVASSLLWGIFLYGTVVGIRHLWHHRFRHAHVA